MSSAFGKNIKKLSDIQKQGAAAVLPGERIEEIDPELIDCETQIRSKDNPGFTVESVTELANDIERDGQHEPAVVRKNAKSQGRYLMVAGERRWRACKLKGIKLRAVVRELSDEQARRVQRAENIQRENLTQIEIAAALRDDKKRLGTLEKVATEWNKGINWVAERLKFLEVVEANGHASRAVSAGVTADVTVVNDLHRLEAVNPAAAQAVIDQAQADPATNVRKVVREKLQTTKGAGQGKGSKPVSRMREKQSAHPVLKDEAVTLAANADDLMQTLCDQYSALSKLLQQRSDVYDALGQAKQSLANAGTELFRVRHALNTLISSKQ